jgi:hypothetical protein
MSQADKQNVPSDKQNVLTDYQTAPAKTDKGVSVTSGLCSCSDARDARASRVQVDVTALGFAYLAAAYAAENNARIATATTSRFRTSCSGSDSGSATWRECSYGVPAGFVDCSTCFMR